MALRERERQLARHWVRETTSEGHYSTYMPIKRSGGGVGDVQGNGGTQKTIITEFKSLLEVNIVLVCNKRKRKTNTYRSH